ncbi:MAG: GAF domain-containing sensor histidine kinase [Chloroflexota bacterium]|jgi:signal transduction histidine kinase
MPSSGRTPKQALAVLHQAALSIASEVSLEKVLQQITDSAREVVGARYAALGVPDAEGQMEKFITSGISQQQAESIAHRPLGAGVLGVIMRESRSIRLPRVDDDPRSVGFPPGHPAMRSFLGVPIMAGNQVLGNLYLTDKIAEQEDGSLVEAGEFTSSDQELVEMLAAHAAIAIQNAHLYEQVGRLAIVEERSRIGMDLHDGVIQSIYAVGLILESARLQMRDEPEEADKSVLLAIAGLNDAIRDIRNFILDLRPQRFTGDLNEALARLIREFQANAMIPVRFSAQAATLSALPAPVARTIFLTTQEALANVARHARANQVTVEIWQEPEMVILCIEDDGVGFNVSQQSQAVGHGLANMRARADELNGVFVVQSAPGEGTQICLRLPILASASATSS